MPILITGTSTGSGEACARWLDARDARVHALLAAMVPIRFAIGL